MRLRWKFFLVLLCFSLIPLLLLTAVNRRQTARLGRAIAGEGRMLLANIVKNELRQTAEDYALVIRRTKSAMDFGLSVLAAEAERALAGPAPEAVVYRAGDLDDPTKAPPDLGPEEGYQIRLKEGGALPLPITREHPVLYFPAGTAPPAGQEARLAGLLPAFQLLRQELGDLLLFVSVTLPDGTHVSWPGHGGYPPDYDPRTRPWYRAAEAGLASGQPGGGGVVWNSPAVDAATGQVTLTLSKALAGPGGRFAGVASLDVLLTRVLQEQEIASQWSQAMRSFLVTLAKDPQTGQPGLAVWAQRSMENHAPDWRSPLGGGRLTSTDQLGLAGLLGAMERESSGVFELPYEDQDCFWAFSRLMGNASFLIIVPKSMLASLSGQASREILSATQEITRFSGIAVLVVLAAVTVAAFASTRAFTRPLTAMVEGWRRLARGDFSVHLDLRVGDERQSLVDAFNETVPVLADHLRLQKSLELAQEVQRNLLPASPPEVPGLDVAGVSLPCDETGGDYFDYRAVTRDGEVCLDTAVGDVTGHGVPSALLMATARALLVATEDSETPAERVRRANRLLCRDVADSGRFMTLLAMEIRPASGQIRSVRAGHDPAMLYDPETEAFIECPGRGIPLGVIPDHPYEETVMAFDRPGQVLLLGTDGIWEARDPSGAWYGKERFMAVVRRAASGSAASIVAAILEDLAAFRAGRRQEDDVTLVVVKKR